MPNSNLARFTLLPELQLRKFVRIKSKLFVSCEKKFPFEVCPKCCTKSSSIYDSRHVRIKDSPLRGKSVTLLIRKRRFWCKSCRKPFTEPIGGVSKGKRTTERFRRDVLWASENFSDLSKVQRAYLCSRWLIYKAVYEQLELRRRKNLNYPWPSIIGIDEHSFKRNKQFGYTDYATLIVDYKNKRPFELVEGKGSADLLKALSAIQGRENVHWVNMDLCQPFRYFVRSFFPNAQIIADKFHVLRLLSGSINKRRKQITGDKRTNPIRRLLLRNGSKLNFFEKSALYRWLENYPELREIYHFKEALFGFYRVKGYERAREAMKQMLDRMGHSKIPEIRTLRKTLLRWREEILNYFRTGLTNARVEGFNNVAKLIKKKAYGYRSFKNYRLRVLNA